jgi:protein arginine kinase
MSGLIEMIGEKSGRWLAADGPEADIVFSSRVRLARNLLNMIFATKATPAEQSTVVDIVKKGVENCPSLGAFNFIDVSTLDQREKHFLMESYAISREMASHDGDKALLLSPDHTLSVMVNEEDHVRIQSLQSGLQLRTAWQRTGAIDDDLGRNLDFAFSDRWGFLTACPTNVGTGLRASAMLHLPALIMTRKIASAVQTVSKFGCAVRGLHGEGTDRMGDFFQVSNQATLGQEEDALVGSVERIASELIAQEKRARQTLLEESKRQTEDRIGRALGILNNARILGHEETMSLLSALRLGMCLGLVAGHPISLVNELMIQVQPAHLEVLAGQELEVVALDSLRADVVQKALSPR